jgi:hypothetical protein
MGEGEDQPPLGDRLHPGADQRDPLPGEEASEIGVAQRAERSAKGAGTEVAEGLEEAR